MDNLEMLQPSDDEMMELPASPSQLPTDIVNIAHHISETDAQIYPSYHNPDVMLSGQDILKEMGEVVVDDFQIDDASRSEWKENVAEDIKLFSSYLEEKTWPWENASNVSLPFLTIAVLQFHARVYEAIIPPKGVVKVLNLNNASDERALRVEKYMDYQLLYKMEDFEEGMDRSLIQLPIEGTIFRKSYYDPIRRVNVSEPISAINFVVNYGAKDLGEETRKTHIIRMPRNVIRKRVAAGVFIDTGETFRDPTKLPGDEISEQVDKIHGFSRPSTDNTNTRVILEQHRGWDLDGDGIEEPYVITVDYETRKVLRITSRSYTDSFGNKRTMEYFTHYCFIPNPNSIYGFGYGTLLRGLNAAANTIVNEVIDAGALANLQGGFVSKRSGIKKGSLRFSMGEFKEVDTYIDDIRKAIYQFDFKGPNQTLYATLGLLYEYSKLVTSVSETMTGQLPASDTPATTVLALIEEGRKVFSSIQKRIHRSFKRELRKLYRLNSIYLNELEYFRVLGEDGVPDGPSMAIGRSDFIDTYDIVPVSDPNIISRAERIIKAQQVKQEVMTNPLMASNPKAVYVATRDFLEALDVKNIDDLLAPPPEPQDVPPVEENAMMIKGQSPTVLPEQDHISHMQVHDSLLNGPFGKSISSQTRKLVEIHNNDHLAALYLVENSGRGGSEELDMGENMM